MELGSTIRDEHLIPSTMSRFANAYSDVILCLQSTEDESIVPCTPTLMTQRPDDTYQAISSPRVPPGTIRFQFEDVTQTPTSLAAALGGNYQFRGSCHSNGRLRTLVPLWICIFQVIYFGRPLTNFQVLAILVGYSDQRMASQKFYRGGDFLH